VSLFDPQTLTQFRSLVLAARRGALSPLLPSAGRSLPGGGTEVTGLRDYTAGDDFRYIDWTLCARRDEILSKCFAGQEDRRLYVLVDCSRSMAVGEPAKFAVARRIAGLLGYVSLLRGDSVVGSGFSGRVVADLVPLRGTSYVMRWLSFWGQLVVDAAPTDLAAAAGAYVRRRQRPGPIVVLSDFYDRQGYTRGLEILRNSGYEPRVVQVVAPAEADAPPAGEIELGDMESADSQAFTLTETMRREYHAAYERFQQSLARWCNQRGLPCLQISSGTDWTEIGRRIMSGKPHRVAPVGSVA
jgi:uncharacterized protein (DUF58 family)